jgi:phosphoribosyl-AMP cyclohydrolase/phosphoribosyl-ATP pyrophosphohydrolase/phosphoribosyl-AMP cyclohydrolase
MKIPEKLKYDEHGLMPAIIQDYRTKEVLMVAYMNEEALKRTLETKKTYFWSRSRQKYWLKGESSGHIQTVKGVYFDCDNDTVLITVSQKGGACHEGYRSCFFKKLNDKGEFIIAGKKVFDPKKVY